MTQAIRFMPVSPVLSAALRGLDVPAGTSTGISGTASAYAGAGPSFAMPAPQNRGALALTAERAATPVPPAMESGLDAAKAAISVEKIKRDVYWLADDARGGRATPSAGQTEAARYLQARLEEFAWAPAGGPETYLYHYKTWSGFFKTEPVETRGLNGTPVKDENVTGFSLSGGGITQNFKYGEDYFYSSLGQKCDCEITGGLVSAGTGLPQEFSGIDAAGKWVVVFDNPLVSPDERRARAKEAGAKGLIVLPHPQYKDKHYDKRVSDQARLAAEGKMRYPLDSDFDEITFTRAGAAMFMPLFRQVTGADGAESLLASRATAGLTFEDKRVLTEPFKQIEADNVVGFFEGSDPALKDEVIILSAHYDHVGTSSGGRIFNGADDNASGSSLLLAMAEAIPLLPPEMRKRSVMLLWLSGEELGLLGSKAWVKAPYFPNGVKPVLNINTDMVGRNDDEQEILITPFTGHQLHNGIVKAFMDRAPKAGIKSVGSANKYLQRSDQWVIRQLIGPDGKPIPVVFYTSGMHDDYHQTTDDPDKIDYEKMVREARWQLEVIALDLQADQLPK